MGKAKRTKSMKENKEHEISEEQAMINRASVMTGMEGFSHINNSKYGTLETIADIVEIAIAVTAIIILALTKAL